MTKTTCDQCGKDASSRDRVYLKGVGHPPSGRGILLPDNCMEKHFCNPACFWEWVIKAVKDSGYEVVYPPRG